MTRANSGTAAPEFSRLVPAARLGTEPFRQDIEASEMERALLASRLDLLALDRLTARCELVRLGKETFALHASFDAEFVQSCVVTLDPVSGRASEEFTLIYGPPETEEEIGGSIEDDVAFALALAGAVGAAQSPYDRSFPFGTMRVDYFHTGGPAGEVVAPDRIVDDGAWPGSRTRLIDDTNLGKYMFEVVDTATSQVVYSRGFASIYGEWETTPEIRSVSRTFHESLRFPWPRGPVEVVLKKRDRENRFGQIWSTSVDPGSRFVNRAGLKAGGVLQPLLENGPAEAKVDLLIIGEGYMESAGEKLRADATRLLDALFALEPFKSRRTDFNVRTLHLPSDESGVSRPRAGVFRRTPLSAEYNIFDLERIADNRQPGASRLRLGFALRVHRNPGK